MNKILASFLCLLTALAFAGGPAPCDPSKNDFYNKHCRPSGSVAKKRPCEPDKPGFYNQNCRPEPEKKPEDTITTSRQTPLRAIAPLRSNKRRGLLEERRRSTPKPIPAPIPSPQEDQGSSWDWMQ